MSKLLVLIRARIWLATTLMHNKRAHRSAFPKSVDESLAAFLGYLIGDGHISEVKRTIGLTSGDEAQADHFAQLAEGAVRHRRRGKQWDKTKWRIKFSSGHVQDFLKHLGLKTGVCARIKDVPDVILRSPKSVVAAFLRAYYDCDGYAGKQGVILSTSSEEMSKTVQLLLLNFGILSSRRPQKDGCWHVHTMGKSAAVFLHEIGFGLQRKQDALRAYIEGHQWFKDESLGRRDRRHRAAAGGRVRHLRRGDAPLRRPGVHQPQQLLAFDHHDPEGAQPFRGHRLRRPPLRHDGHAARADQSLQAGHRASPRHRAPLEHRASSARSTTSATTWRSGATGTSNWAWDGRKSSRFAAFITILPSSTRS